MTPITLKQALRGNALFSFLCAITLLIYHDIIAALLGDVSSGWLFILGLNLLVFGLVVLLVCERRSVNLTAVKIISSLDVVWIFASGLVLAVYWERFTPLGVAIIDGIGFVVVACAYFQFRGIKQLRTANHATAMEDRKS